jgi:hypothetical protein
MKLSVCKRGRNKQNYEMGVRQRTRELLIRSGSHPVQKKSTVTTTKRFEQPEGNKKKKGDKKEQC